MKTIIVVVAANGESRVEAHGFAGADCRQATQLLRQALGRTVNEQLTPEYYAQSQRQPTQAEQHQ